MKSQRHLFAAALMLAIPLVTRAQYTYSTLTDQNGATFKIAKGITDYVAPSSIFMPSEQVVADNGQLELQDPAPLGYFTFYYNVPNSDPGSTVIYRINNNWDEVGLYAINGVAHGFLRLQTPPFTFSNIDFPGASNPTGPLGINDARQIVGEWADGLGNVYGYSYDGTSFQSIIYPGAVWTLPLQIDNAGTVVGEYHFQGQPSHGFILSGGKFTTVDYPGAAATSLHGIGNSGQMVGTYVDSLSNTRGLLLSGTTFTSIDYPGATATRANDININGKVVGSYDYVEVTGHPTTAAFLAVPTIVGEYHMSSGGDIASNGAQLIVPPGVFSTDTGVALDVLPTALSIPNPGGYAAPATHFVIVDLAPEPSFPLPSPGVTLTLPATGPMTPGDRVDLFRVDTSGRLVPEPDITGSPAIGTVDAGGVTATFKNVAQLSTLVGLTPETIRVAIDIKPGENPPSIQPKSHGFTPVAILSSESFNAPQMVDVPTLTFGRTGNENSLAFCSGPQDVNGDGLPDLVCHFTTVAAGFQAGDAQGILKGKTVKNVHLQGSDTIRIVP